MSAATRPGTDLAVVGSPSTTTRVTLNVRRGAYQVAVYGQMVTFEVTVHPPGEAPRTELAMGTVTEVETINPVHKPTAPEAQHIAANGRVHGTGDEGDTRGISVTVEAVFRRDPEVVPGQGSRVWVPAGSSLSNSPATGTGVRLLDQAQVDSLMDGVPDQRWLGALRGSSTLVPWTARDFSGPRGAYHSAVCGTTGSGKTQAVAYMMACDLFHDRLAQVIYDPQGQWATEHGMVFSLQGLAEALGRTVTVARLSRSLRLRKDAPMFTELLARAGLFTEIAFGSGADAQVANAARVMEDALDDRKALTTACGTGDWTEADPGDLLAYLLGDLRETLPTGVVYAGSEGQQRVAYAIAPPHRGRVGGERAGPGPGRPAPGRGAGPARSRWQAVGARLG